jgi:hypothetical protein
MALNENGAVPGATGTARYDQRSHKNTGPSSQGIVTPISGMRRRRAASARLAPLAHGVHDPLDELAGLPFRQVEYGVYDVTDLGLTCQHNDETCPAWQGAAS